MLTKGLMKTCDRCGESVFLRVVDTGERIQDNIWPKFEDGPSGWMETKILKTCEHDVARSTTVTLCSVCAMMLTKINDAFMEYYPEEMKK